MKIAVVVFPGSNCDIDLYEALHTVLDADVEYVLAHFIEIIKESKSHSKSIV